MRPEREEGWTLLKGILIIAVILTDTCAKVAAMCMLVFINYEVSMPCGIKITIKTWETRSLICMSIRGILIRNVLPMLTI